MRVLSIVIFAMLMYIQASNDLLEFRVRKKELGDIKADCEKKLEPKRTDCLEAYEKKVTEYKADFAKFKANAILENTKRNERRAESSSKTIQSDINKRTESIKEFENFYNSSCDKQGDRCGLALFQLGNLCYNNEEDEFRIKQGDFEKAMQKWEDQDKRGSEPVAPKRFHVKSMEYFDKLLKQYPDYPDIPKVYFRVAFIYSIQGNDDKMFEYLTKLVNEYPKSALVVPSYLRLGEYWFLMRKYKKAIENYEKIPPEYGGVEAGMALYHKAESYYNMADFETAAKFYYTYVIKADKGIIKADLKEEALEFMAACWADMDNGVDVAYKFLKGKGHSWEKDVYFQMGEKNRSHDRLEEARKAFKHLLDIDPNYPQAPVADMAIVQTLEIEKRADEAQSARLAIVERYKPGSQWESANTGNKANKEKAEAAVKMAMFQIPLYYHVKGSKEKDNLDLELLNKAEQHYRNYLSRYNEKSWNVYEVHQNLGSVYHLMKQYSNAANEYKWCSKADVNTYGKMPSDKKKSILTRADAAYNAVYMLDLDREQALKSVSDDKEKAYALPETKAYFNAVEEYMQDYGKSNSAPDIAYNSAMVHYEAKQYEKSIEALNKLVADFPNHKHSNLIRRMLGQSLLENGQFAQSEEVFTNLLKKLSSNDKDYQNVQLSIASAIFKQADEKAKQGENKEAARLYLRMVDEFGKAKIADMAIFEAGIQYEKAGEIPSAANCLLRIYKEYPKSELVNKSILKAASVYMKDGQYKESGETFLILPNNFPKDSSSFNAIGWAADAFQKIPDSALAARTYESAYNYFPDHVQTASFLYNAGQIHEENKDFGNAIRVYGKLQDKFPKSSYALEAAFSVPIIQEKQGNYSQAAESYKRFIKSFGDDPQKLIRAQLGAGKIYDDHLGKDDDALGYYEMAVKTFEKFGDEKKLPSAIAAEALFRSGQIYFEKVSKIQLNSDKRENAKRLKQMTDALQIAVEKFSGSMEQEEQMWTLRSTMRIGDLFMKMAEITGNERIYGREAAEIVAEKVNLLKGLPNLYEKGRSMYQKNLDLARENNLRNEWIDSSEVRYMETYYLKGQVFEEIGRILSEAPIPDELTPEKQEEYKELLKDKVFESEQAAKPIYATALKAAQFYSISNEFKEKIKARLEYIDPEAEELKLRELSPEEKRVVFIDEIYKKNMEKINTIYEDPSMSDAQKNKKLREMEAAAKEEAKKLSTQLNPEKAE